MKKYDILIQINEESYKKLLSLQADLNGELQRMTFDDVIEYSLGQTFYTHNNLHNNQDYLDD